MPTSRRRSWWTFPSIRAPYVRVVLLPIAVRQSREASDLFPSQQEIRERLGSIARFYGNLIGVKYGEPFVMKETMRVDDITAMGVRSL